MAGRAGKFETLVRIGYFARAVLYIVLGYLALTSAGAVGEGTEGIFRALEDLPAGTLLLWVLVVGLAGYALFRLASLLLDIEHSGSDAKGWAKRIGHGGSALAHVVLAWTAYQFATGTPSDGDGASEAAAGVMSVEFGSLAIGILGIAFFAAAAVQAEKGISGRFMRRIAADAPSATRWIGGAGYAARAAVFAVIGWSLVEAGFMAQGAGNVKTLGEAVAALAGIGWAFTLVAAGLLLFGLFSLILARWRIIPDLDARGKIPSFRS